MMTGGLLITGVFFGVGVCVLAYYLFRSRQAPAAIESLVLKHSQEALKQASEQLLILAEERFKTEQSKAAGALDAHKEHIHATIERLAQQLTRYESMMKEFEQDRTQKFGRLEKQLEEAVQGTDTLQKTTAHLTAILGNVKQRGQWGERMAEDILQYCGLQEGIHYEKQKTFETNALRPDYTFLLPGEHKLIMDVKFPLSRYNDYVNAASDMEKEQYKKQFLDDVNSRIRDLAKKDYAPAGENTLDYTLMFIPNEQVYAFVNETQPGIIDTAIQKKIILCSPWTLYAVLRIVWQAWQNYNYSEGLKEIIGVISEFRSEFHKFKECMERLGGYLDKAGDEYQKMVGVRQKKLDRKMEMIEQFGSGTHREELS